MCKFREVFAAVTGVATTFFFAVLVFIISTDQLGAQEQGAQVGVAVDGGSFGLSEFETSIGREVDVHRKFARWDDEFPSADDINILNGRDMILSVRARRRNGEPILWADIAAAQPGDPLYQDMVGWAEAIRPLSLIHI